MKNKILSFVCWVFSVISLFAQSPNWSVNTSNYQYSMTITAFLNVNGTTLTNTNDKIGAFVGSQARGEATVVYNANADKYLAYLTVYANTQGEAINFKIYDSQNNTEVSVAKTETFVIDANVGGVFQSYSVANPPLQQVAKFTSFGFQGITAIANTITTNQVNIVLPNGTSIASLTPVFTTEANGKVYLKKKEQTSGSSSVDFSQNTAIVYEVLSEDEQNLQDYTINVSVAATSNPTTVTLSSNSSVYKTKVFTATIDFSNEISGLIKDDFRITNGFVKELTAISAQKFQVKVVALNQGEVTIQLPSNKVVDTDANGNQTSNQLKVIYDIDMPVIKEIIPNGTEFTVEFSEEVINVSADDFALHGIAKQGFTIKSLQTVNPSTYTISLTDLNTKKGNVFVLLKPTIDIQDLAGNKLQNQNIQQFYLDNKAPDIPVLPDVVAECSATITAPTTSDNYSGTITGTTSDALSYFSQGNYTITWAFTDEAGNTSTATQNVIIKDTINPETPTLPDVVGNCSVSINTAPTTTDNCSGTITGTTTDTTSFNSPGNYEINWTFTDEAGNSTTAKQNVIVNSVNTFTIPTLADVVGQCSVTVTEIPVAYNSCASSIQGTTTDVLTYNQQGTYTITWNFDDGNGNSGTATQKVIVQDTEVPVVPILPTITEACSATLTAPTATDNCSGTITGTTNDPLTYTSQGSYIVTWKFIDAEGNESTTTQNVIIKDEEAPVVPTLSDITEECSVTITAPTTTDTCSGTITATTSDALSYTTQGNYIITWNFTDEAGNTSTATQNVIIKDITNPVTPTLPDVVGNCSVSINTAPTTTDNCSGTIIGTTTDTTSFNSPGNYEINWAFTDEAGNSTTAKQNVIVNSVNTFTIPTLADVVGQCSVTVTEIPVAHNSCANSIQGTTTDALTYNQQGTYTITWNFDDGNGNTGTATQKVIVEDTELPIVQAKTTLEIDLQGGSSVSISITDIEISVSDNCGIDSKTLSKTEFTGADIGVNTIQFTVTDVHGNQTVKDIVVTVKDSSLTSENIDLKTQFDIYPNPIRNFLQISSQNYLIEEVIVFNINGRKIISEQVGSTSFRLNVQHFSNGVYLIKIKTELGEITKKVVK